MSKKVYVKPYPKEFREQVVKLVQQAERDQGRRQDGLSSPERSTGRGRGGAATAAGLRAAGQGQLRPARRPVR